MANHEGRTLSRLIRERSYQAGRLQLIERQLVDADAALTAAKRTRDRLRSEIRTATHHLNGLDQSIQAYDGITPADIRPVRRYGKRSATRYGVLTAALVQIFIEAEGPITTLEIRARLVEKSQFPVTTAAEQALTADQVRDAIKKLLRRGLIARLHEPSQNRVGCWMWLGR